MNENDNRFNETERLAELESFAILDSLTERDYDDITEMAALICDVPVALITFVDGKRQWFKSHYGTDFTETPREIAFCSHAILTPNEPLIIEDTHKDIRFQNNPLVTGDPNIGFYAGSPIVTELGNALGTVCVIDTKPRKLTEKQIASLNALSRQVVKLLELRKINNEVMSVNLRLSSDNSTLDNHNRKLQLQMHKQAADSIRELAEKNTLLEKANLELQAFTYISSHDLQEPLRKIQTFISWVNEHDYTGLSERGKLYLDKITQSSSRMSALIRDLLSYSRTTASEKIFEPTDMSVIIDDIQNDLEEELNEKDGVLQLHSDQQIPIIRSQFRQMIYNLVSNSLKFSQDDVAPHIQVYCNTIAGSAVPGHHSDPQKNYHYIKISDNGIGFDNQYSEKIFGLFQRLHDDALHRGTGIGLTIVRKIVDNHKGFIRAESKENAGATFHIYLPEKVVG